jgi:hypothetical protein
MKWSAHKHTQTDKWYVKDEEGNFLVINTTEDRAKLIAGAPEVRDALRDLTERIDGEELRDGSSLDTAWAHALIDS